jgi:hypothetical protein
VRPGHEADVIDLSDLGALIETRCRLLPGTSVEIHLSAGESSARMRGRIVRCAVARLGPDGVWYRAALAFDAVVSWTARSAGERPAHAPETRAPGGRRVHAG